MEAGQFKPFDGEDSLFETACALADTKPTKRQYSKYRRGFGKAYSCKREAIRITIEQKAEVQAS